MVDIVEQLLEGGDQIDWQTAENAANIIKKLREDNEKLAVIVRRIYAEHLPNTWFVCGEYGMKDQNGLPKFIQVCPAYGVDWSQVYERQNYTVPGMGG